MLGAWGRAVLHPRGGGLGLAAEWGGLALTFVGGALFSVHAIETPGGDDDRQWLTFWMIMMLFFLAERFTDVLLSRLPRYYEVKFGVIVWLMFWQGADKLYRVARRGLKRLSSALPWLFPPRPEPSEAEYVATLPLALRQDAATLGVRALFGSFTSDDDVGRRYDGTTVAQLWQMWNQVDPRYLRLRLLSASGLPPMDAGESTDAYVVAYLVPPAVSAERAAAEAEAAAELEAKNRAASKLAASFFARKVARAAAQNGDAGGGRRNSAAAGARCERRSGRRAPRRG